MSQLKLIWGKLGKLFAIPWYPFAISAYPVLKLLAANLGEVGLDAGLRPLLISLLFGGVLFLILRLVLRKGHKAAFLTALWLALIISYGHLYISLDKKYPDAN